MMTNEGLRRALVQGKVILSDVSSNFADVLVAVRSDGAVRAVGHFDTIAALGSMLHSVIMNAAMQGDWSAADIAMLLAGLTADVMHDITEGRAAFDQPQDEETMNE